MVDAIILNIQAMLDKLPSVPSKASIFKVDRHLGSEKWDSAYHPEIISIGPYHHRNPALQGMEQLKHQYLKQLLKRKNEQSMEKYVAAVVGMKERARKCYSEPLAVNENEFVTLLVIDGCFLVELLRYCGLQYLRDVNDPVFKHQKILSHLRHDILLLENQLPFFVLNQLFNMTKTNENPNDELIDLALGFVDGLFLKLSVSRALKRKQFKNIDHLFGLIHDVWCIPFADEISIGTGIGKKDYGGKWENINSISGLREAGIKLRKKKGSGSLMDITFVNGELRIPKLEIFDETESQFRNLIAYEQLLPDGEPRYGSDYAFFMHCLINNPKDVEVLRSCKIIGNWLGDDDKVCRMFNQLGRNILISSNFSYSQVFCSINKHCSQRAEKWKANLRRNYFNSPWAIFSFLAAVTLLILTAFQTGYTIRSYYHRTK